MNRFIASATIELLTLSILLLALCCPLPAQDAKENADFKLAVGLYNDGMYDLAVEQLKNFIAAYPATSQGIDARYQLGLAQMKLKRYDEARVTFQNFALTYTDHSRAPDAWMQVGEAFAAAGNDREAASAYERVKVFHPKSPIVPEALLNASSIYRKAGEHESAKKTLRTIIQDYPSSKSLANARLILAEVYADEGQSDLAEREARRVAESDASSNVKASALLFLGRLQASVSLFDDAAKTFRTLITTYKKAPQTAAAMFEMGSLEMGAGDYAAAIDHFKVAASDEASGDSLRARAYFNIGKLNALQSRFSEAVQSYKKVFTLLPASPTGSRALLEAGRSALEAGMKKSNKEDANEALQYATRILSSPVSPYSGGAMILAARACGYLRRYTDAASYFQQFIDEYPDDPFTPDMMFRLGKLCKDDLKNYRKALSVYDLIVQRYPQSPFALDAMLEIGECQEMTGDYAGALSTYNDVQTFFSAHSAYDTVRNKIEFIRNFKIKNTDDALENLARLLGEGFTKTSKGNLSFALGLIFFNDLKNYVSAEQEFANAIENGVEAERLPEALFLRARASHFQSVIDPGLVPKAVSYYEVFLNQYPSGNHSEEAAYYTYLLRRDSSGRQAAMLKEFLSKYPTSKHADELALLLAKTLWSANDYAGANSLYNSLRVSPEISLQFSEAMLQRGLTYLKLGLNDSALSSWRRAIAVPVPNRSSVQAMWELADVHWKRNDISEAVMLWKGITSDFPYTSYAEQSKHRLGEGYLAAKEYDEAISLYERRFSAMEKDPVQEISDYSDAFGLANAYERKGELQKSIAYYNQYLLNNRKGQYAGTCFYSLGRIAKARGNAALPASYFKQASASGSTEATANDIPDLLFQTEQYAEAAKQYRLLAGQTVDADRKKYYQSRAVISLLRTGKLSDAQAVISDFEKTFGKDKPALAEFEYEKAGVYYRKQDFTTAAKLYEKVADDFEDTRFGPFGQYYAGKILEATNKLAEAAKKYESIINHYPGSEVLPRVFLSLGNMHFNAERYEEAIRYYQRVTNDPSGDSTILPYAMNNLIKAYESTKLYDDAIKMTRDFIERFPNEESIPDKKIKLGTLYTRVGYYDQAVLHFQNLLNDAGSDVEAEIRYNIGEAYYDKGDYQQSLLEFLKVPYLVSKQGKVNWTATSLYMAGQAYERMSKFDEAIGMYQQIIDRPGIDATFKAGARKEIDRVKTLTKKGSQ